jgi:hypothetical protein
MDSSCFFGDICIQGVSEIRVLILTSGKILNKLTIKVYTRLWVRAKIFCCDRNRAFLESSIVIGRKK